MLTKRIIPCLDIKDGKVVKGTKFLNLKDAGDPIELGKFYSESGADELVFLDISATQENRNTLVELVKKISKNLQIPFTVGGGIKSVNEIEEILKSGADKVSLNSAAIKNPNLIKEASEKFGSQAIVVAIDYKKEDGKYTVFSAGGTIKTNLELFDWCKDIENLGAGELLLTGIDSDGTKKGFDTFVLDKISKLVNIPIIASGGAGKKEDFLDLFNINIDGALAASVFHFGEIEINDLKKYLQKNNIKVRI